MHVFLSNQQNDLNIDVLPVATIVEAVIDLEGQVCHEVGLNFVDEERICALHKEFFNDPSPTDCISFPIDLDADTQGYRVLGDVFVCPQSAKNYSAQHGVEPHNEVILYVVHGLLHLMGYDDIHQEDLMAMREAERRHMANLKKLGFLGRDG